MSGYGSGVSDVPGNSSSVEEEVILAIDIKGKKIGFSILDCSSKVLKILDQDYTLSFITSCQIGTNFSASTSRYLDEIVSIVDSLLLQNRPTICIVSSRINPDCIEQIENKCDATHCKLELLGNDMFNNTSDFDFINIASSEDGGYLLSLLQKGEELVSVTRSTVSAVFGYYLDFSQGEKYVDTSRSNIRITNSGKQNIIQYIEAITLSNRMLLDAATLRSLNIFPEAKYGQDKMVENGNFSIFQLFNKTSSKLAKSILMNWLLFPLIDISEIKARSGIVSLLVHPNNSILFNDLCFKLKKCPNMQSILNSLKTGNATFKEWVNLHYFLVNSSDIYYILSSFSMENVSSKNIITEIVKNVRVKIMKDIKQRIESIINIGETNECKKIQLRDGLDENLDTYRHDFGEIEKILEDKAYEEELNIKKYFIEKLPNKTSLSERFLNILYIPQIGYLASVNNSFREREILEEIFNWHCSFETSTTTYFVTPFTIELNDSYGDIYSFILDLQVEILHDLQEYVLQFENELYYCYRKIAELDVLTSFATVAQFFSYTEPSLTEDDCSIHVSNGRHPLYETIVKSYIPNSISLNGSFFKDNNWQTDGKTRIALVTGANGSGKTVYLTQIGLIVYLAQIGSFVPADNARIGIVDRILARIHSKESLSINRSSFENDMMQMSNCVSLCSERSLLLVDEFGKGTDPVDGPALFGSIIKYFSENSKCPRIVACTHFSELFQEDILSTDIKGIQFLRTEIFINARLKEDINDSYVIGNDKNVNVFLYTIVPGLSANSLGVLCAKICGMKEEIIKRASEFSKLIVEGRDLVTYCSVLNHSEEKTFQRNQEIIKEFLQWDLDLETMTSPEVLAQKLISILDGYKIPKELSLDL